MKRKNSTSSSKVTNRAKWSDAETNLLVEKINAGERVADIQYLFPSKTLQQIHSKVSSLKSKKLVEPQNTSLAPSIQPVDDILSEVLSDTTNDCEFSNDDDLDILSPPTSMMSTPTVSTPSVSTPIVSTPIVSTPPSTGSTSTKTSITTKPCTSAALMTLSIPPISTTSKFKLHDASEINSKLEPLLVWAFTHANWWVVIIPESSYISFSMKVQSNGLLVNWKATPPSVQHLSNLLGLGESDLQFYIQNLSGQYHIPSPQPIENNPKLVEKVPCTTLRILKIPFVFEAHNEF